MSSNRRLILRARLVSLIACAAMLGSDASAQNAMHATAQASADDTLNDFMVRESRPTGCITDVVPLMTHRTLVTLAASMDPRTDSAFRLQADLIAQDVAGEIRKSLGSSGEAGPDADGRVQWYSVPAQIIITARSDGGMQWRTRGFLGDSSAATMLSKAFELARADGGAMMVWPEGNKADSIVFRLSLARLSSDERSMLRPGEKRVKFVAFYLPMPVETNAIPVPGQASAVYPAHNERYRVAGSLIMQLVVDTTGRAIPSTIHDLWPAGKPPLKGDLGEYYREFVYSMTLWEKQLKYTPARIGGCAVNQVVEQPVAFVVP